MSRLGCASSWKMVACTGRSCVLSRGWTGHWNGICLRQWDIHGIFISWDICIRDNPSISIYRHYLYSSNRSISFRYHLFLYLSKCRSARWFTANQLKPRRGFRATVLQIGFMMELWFVRSSVSVELEEICLTVFIRGFLEWPWTFLNYNGGRFDGTSCVDFTCSMCENVGIRWKKYEEVML